MNQIDQRPLVIAFVADLMFAVRIESAAEQVNFRLRLVENSRQIAPPDPHVPERQLAEHLIGPGAALMEQITSAHPALIIFDLGNAAVPWREWIALIKSAPATRRIPVICFGSHVDTGSLHAAREAGAEAVLSRSRFSGALPELIRKYASLQDSHILEDACQQPLSDLALRGLEEFNRGEYFEAHESLEAAWKADSTAGRELYRAILQVAVAYLQIQRRNYRGVLKMFLRMRQWIDPLPDTCRGVNVARLRTDAYAVREKVLELGPYRLAEFDSRSFQPVRYSIPGESV